MKFLFGLVLHCANAYAVTPVDPDALPSVEVLLVPPKSPYPQVRSTLMKIRQARETSEKRLEEQIRSSYSQQRKLLVRQIPQLVTPYLKGLVPPPYRTGSLLQTADVPGTAENVAITILPMPSSVGLNVKSTINEIDSKRNSDIRRQISQATHEFSQIGQVIVQSVTKSLKRYFKNGGKISFLQEAEEENPWGFKPVLNVRVGSSSVGDGMVDGASFPSVFGMVQEENESRDSGEIVLLNEIQYYTRQLGNDVLALLRQVAFPYPSSFLEIPGLSQGISAATKFLPPPFMGTLRKRAFKHSTVELALEPPVMDDYTIVEQLNAMLQSEVTLEHSRTQSYIQMKRKLVKTITTEIDQLVRYAAVAWGVITDPSNVR